MKNRILKAITFSFAFAVIVVCGAFVLTDKAEALAIVDQGSCGDNVTWTLDIEGTLTIAGEGEMADYGEKQSGGYHLWSPPWKNYRNDITSIVIQSGVTHIGVYAFGECTNAVGVWIPEGVQTIGTHAFMNCTGLTDITIPQGVESIGAYAFNNCSGLRNISIPNTVQLIGNSAFSRCSSVSSISIPSSVEVIENSAFSSCTGLRTLTLSNGLTTIGQTAFAYCTGITSVTIPRSVTDIGSSAFAYCSNLKYFSIGNQDCNVGENIFLKCDLQSNSDNGFVVFRDILFSYCGNGSVINIPSNIKRIDGFAFGNKTSITRVFLPSGLEIIGAVAFQGCTSLQSIDLPSSVTKIGSAAFEDTAITSLVIPYGVSELPYGMCSSCSNLESISIPDSVESIDWEAFFYCTSLRSIEIPESVQVIGGNVFYGCTALENLKLPGNLEYVESCLLEGCNNLNTVILRGNNLEVGDSAISGCTMQKLIIGKGVNKLDAGAFDSSHASYIEVSGEIESLPDYAGALGLTDMNSSVTVVTERGTYSDAWFRDKYPNCTYKYSIGSENITVDSCTYTGEPLTPAVTIPGLTEGVDFTVEYSNNVEVGTGTATITGIGSYVNTVDVEFEIQHAEALTHVPAVEPTCTEEGNIEYWKCTHCGKMYSDENGTNEVTAADVVLAAKGHDWYGDYTVDVEPTCTTAGSKSIHCKNCSEVKDEETVPALQHSYAENVIDPTCTQAGYTLHICGRCGDTYTDTETDALGHSYGEWVETETATCTNFGAEERECTRCGCKETRGIDKAEHNWSDDYILDQEATCTSDGSESIRCQNEGCDAVLTSRVIPGGHLLDDHVTTDVEATCTATGSMSVHCKRCTEKLYQVEIPALGHNYEPQETPAEIGIEGKSWLECSRCHNVKDEAVIPALKPDATKIKSVKAASKAFTVKWVEKPYSGYQIRYSLKSSMSSSKTKTITKATTTSKKVTKLKSKKKYYVQVRTYQLVNGEKCYSKWSSKSKVTTK